MGFSLQQVAQQARNKRRRRRVMYRQLAEVECVVEMFGGVGRRCQDLSREIQMLSKRQEIFKNAVESNLRVQSRASERLQDQIIE